MISYMRSTVLISNDFVYVHKRGNVGCLQQFSNQDNKKLNYYSNNGVSFTKV